MLGRFDIGTKDLTKERSLSCVAVSVTLSKLKL